MADENKTGWLPVFINIYTILLGHNVDVLDLSSDLLFSFFRLLCLIHWILDHFLSFLFSSCLSLLFLLLLKCSLVLLAALSAANSSNVCILTQIDDLIDLLFYLLPGSACWSLVCILLGLESLLMIQCIVIKCIELENHGPSLTFSRIMREDEHRLV